MKYIFLFYFFIFPFFNLFSQDIIVKKDGSEIKAKVVEIDLQKIKYKEFDFQNGPIRNIDKSDVFMIIYQNGKRENFNNDNPQLKEQKKIKTQKKSDNTPINKKGFSFIVEANTFYLFFFPKSRFLNYTKYIENIKFKFYVDDDYWFNIFSSFETNISSKYNFNNTLGIKSGFGVEYLEFTGSSSSDFESDDGRYVGSGYATDDINITYLQIPISLVLTFGQKIGLNLESGVSVNVPIASNCNESTNAYLYDNLTDEFTSDENSSIEFIDGHINTTINSFFKLGITFPISKNIKITAGPTVDISLNETYNNYNDSALPKRQLAVGFSLQCELR